MALPSPASFSSPHAGLLTLTLTGAYSSTRSTDPSNRGATDNIGLRCYAGPVGAYTYSTLMDKYQQSVTLKLAYPGGGASWQIGVEEVFHQGGGLVTYRMEQIRLVYDLVKKVGAL